MILLDPDLGPDLAPPPRPNGKRLAELPIRRGANGAPRSGAGVPKSNWRRAPLPWAERLPAPATLDSFLRQAQEAVRLRGQVSVLLTTDAAIRELNRQFRGKKKATDVLSFPAMDLSQVSKSRTGAPASEMVGDLAISVDTARKQAAEQGHALTCELKILMLHGLLHLAGYDHETDAGEMARRERALRAKFGLPLGLIERVEGSRAASRRVSESASSRSILKKRSKGGAIAQKYGPKVRSTASASRREATKIAQGEAKPGPPTNDLYSLGWSQRNPGKAPVIRARRPVGPARKPAAARHRSPKP